MKNALSILSVGVFLSVSSHQALACASHEYEQCWRVDLGPLGTAKDCKCVPKIGGEVGKAAEAVKPTIANLVSEVRKTPQAVNDCIRNVGTCIRDVLAAPLAAPLHAYMDMLYKQSEGRVYPLPPQLIALAQQYYSVNLHGVTYALGINTGHGMTVAYCDRIFFAPSNLNVFQNYQDLHLTLHELEHTVQCQGRGKSTYLAEYILKGAWDMVRSGQVNVHDMHDYEVAASNKADRVAPLIWQRIQAMQPHQQWLNYCQTPVGTCQIPANIGVRGSPCYCQTPMGVYNGAAY